MPCEYVKIPGGGVAIVNRARRRKCFYCPAEHAVLCDAVNVDGRTTCDRYCCRAHAKNVGPDKDLCRDHALEAANGVRRKLAL